MEVDQYQNHINLTNKHQKNILDFNMSKISLQETDKYANVIKPFLK